MKTKLSALSLAMLSALATSSVVAKEQIKGSEPELFDNSVIVVYKDNVSKSRMNSIRRMMGARIKDKNRDGIDDRFSNLLEGRIAQYELRSKSVKQAIAELRKNPDVKIAEPNYKWKPAVISSDEFSGELWGLNNEGQTGGTVDADIDAPEAWAISTGSKDVVIGVIDTGVDYTHPDLVENMWVNEGEIPDNGIDDDGNGYIDDIHGIDALNGDSDPMDDHSHGTHVSGTIGASANNEIGVVGVNHHVSIAACKFLGDGGGSTAGGIECVNYFTDLKKAGVNIVATSNSWGGGGYSEALYEAIKEAGENDILFIAAAGNDGIDNDQYLTYPASYDLDSIISVASTDHNDESSGFSYGLETVDIAAPGSEIWSTIPGEEYASYSGTSMATPHVSGVAALLAAIDPGLSGNDIKQMIMFSGDANEWANGRTVSGNRLNAFNAAVLATGEGSFYLSASNQSEKISAGEAASFSITLNDLAGFDESITLSLDDASGLAQLSSTTAVAGDIVTLDVTTTEDTEAGVYPITFTATGGDIERTLQFSVTIYPANAITLNFASEDTPLEITEGLEPITSSITVPEGFTALDMAVTVDITHAFAWDLTIWLTSPTGTSVTLRKNEGYGMPAEVEVYEVDDFAFEPAAGVWTLHVLDDWQPDVGTLNSWSMSMDLTGEAPSLPPITKFSYVEDVLQVTFTNESIDYNFDIVSYMWDFGDGNTSTEENPVHTFSETGVYEVSLTVTDAEGQSTTLTESIAVSSNDIQASVDRTYFSRLGAARVYLSFTGTDSEMVTIYRDGEEIATVANTGKFVDRIRRVSGDLEYVICDDTTACSDPISAQQ